MVFPGPSTVLSYLEVTTATVQVGSRPWWITGWERHPHFQGKPGKLDNAHQGWIHEAVSVKLMMQEAPEVCIPRMWTM